MQRLLDLLFSGIALVVLAPLLIPVIVVLRLTGEGDIFFRQERIGKGGQPFGLLKFATMLRDSPNMGTGTVTLANDPRVLPFGRFLRATKINEIPQLINIFMGDMSVIGPRPQTKRCFDSFPEQSKQEIIKVSPGLSGVGSIVFRDEQHLMQTSSNPEWFYDSVIMPYKGQLEEWYVNNRGLGTYLLLIGITAWVLVFPRSPILWRSIKSLPSPPPELARWINYDASNVG